jgi:hypothetical protein
MIVNQRSRVVQLKYFLICVAFFALSTMFLSLFTISKNYPRLYILRSHRIINSVLSDPLERDEGIFNVSIFPVKRRISNRYLNQLNRLYSDKIMVVEIPVDKFRLKNLILKPKGKDTISGNSDFYFNTLFFTEDFNPTTGMIYESSQIGRSKPVKTRIGISEKGVLTIVRDGENMFFKNVLQSPFVLTPRSNVKNNLKTLNYRHFISLKNGKLFYISGYKNSLVCWEDVRLLMRKNNLTYVIALDGGKSLHYYFRGTSKTYSYSSIPYRYLWFDKNSPFYIEGYSDL